MGRGRHVRHELEGEKAALQGGISATRRHIRHDLFVIPRPPRWPGELKSRSANYSPRALAASSFLTSSSASAMALASERSGATRQQGAEGASRQGRK